MQNAELKEVLGLILSAIEAGFAFADGFQFSDVAKGIEAIKKLPAIKKAEAAFNQYKSMSDQEALELEDFVVTEFDVSDDKVEQVIEGALKVVIDLHAVAGLIKPTSGPVVVPV